jgi:hypothetical protein
MGICQGLVVLGALMSCVGFAGPMTYLAIVDTSSISGTDGSLDYNFNPGPLVSQPASLQILAFRSNGILEGAPSLIGNVSGSSLPATMTFDNGAGFNDYFQGFTFGSMLVFNINLYGPALSAPDGISTSGSTFAFSMFLDSAGTLPALTTDLADGFALTIEVNLDGTTTLTNFSDETSIEPTSAAEPRSVHLLGTSLVLMCLLLRFRAGSPQRLRTSAVCEVSSGEAKPDGVLARPGSLEGESENWPIPNPIHSVISSPVRS